MIATFAPRNFKCFQEEEFALRALTLLTGINGSGKSSFIQALVLVRQAQDPTNNPQYVKLNGYHELRLGRALDVLNFSLAASEQRVSPTLKLTSGEMLAWQFDAGDAEELVLRVSDHPSSLSAEAQFLFDNFTYLCAEREGPRDLSPMDAVPTQQLGVGPRGEFVAHVLVQRERDKIPVGRRHPHTPEGGAVYLGKQAELWMRDLIPDLELRVETIEGSNAVALKMRKLGVTSEWLRPTNMAFGATYALPIIVAGLLAPQGGVLVVENPEAHLHPSAQSRIGRFLAAVAADGVQVIAESHSDHVLNGLRLSIAQGSALKPEEVVIHHFGGDRPFVEIKVDTYGGLSTWPRNFFDQSEQDLASLVSTRRGRRSP